MARSRSRERHRDRDGDREVRHRDRERSRSRERHVRSTGTHRATGGGEEHHRADRGDDRGDVRDRKRRSESPARQGRYHRSDRGEDRERRQDRPRRSQSPGRRPSQPSPTYTAGPPVSRAPPPAPRVVPPPAPMESGPPPVGSIHNGQVHTIRGFGMFIALAGYKRHVLVHHSQINEDLKFSRDETDEDKIKAMEYFFPKGSDVKVKVTELTPDPRNPGEARVNGSMVVVNQDTGQDLDVNGSRGTAPTGGGARGPQSDKPPDVGTIHRGTVKRIEPYGVFVAMDGFRKFGLVHSSQVSSYINFNREDTDEDKKAELAGVVSIGEQIWVKVVEIVDDGGERGPKIQCSIKLVDQKTGEDLDPLNSRYQPRGVGGGGRPPPGGIGSDAGNVVGGVIQWGHLAGDLHMHVPGKQSDAYSMLDDDPSQRRPTGLPPGPPQGVNLMPPPPPPKQITSIEEALAILEQASKGKNGKKEKDKGKDKSKKKKKEKKEHKKKSKSSKEKRSKDSSSSSESG